MALRMFSSQFRWSWHFLWNLINFSAIAHRFSAITVLFAFICKRRVRSDVKGCEIIWGCTMCIHTNTHKLFVPCHKLWIFDQSQVFNSKCNWTNNWTQFFSFVYSEKKDWIEQPLVFVTALCRFKFWRAISTAILKRGKRAYLFYWTRHIDSFVEPTLHHANNNGVCRMAKWARQCFY